MFELVGKRALVTGATGGIGGAVARALHAQGAQVALSGSREEVLAFFARPVPALIAALGLVVGIRHLMMEAHEAVEDYVGGINRKLTLVAVTAFCYTLMAADLFALLKIAL